MGRTTAIGLVMTLGWVSIDVVHAAPPKTPEIQTAVPTSAPTDDAMPDPAASEVDPAEPAETTEPPEPAEPEPAAEPEPEPEPEPGPEPDAHEEVAATPEPLDDAPRHWPKDNRTLGKGLLIAGSGFVAIGTATSVLYGVGDGKCSGSCIAGAIVAATGIGGIVVGALILARHPAARPMARWQPGRGVRF